MALGDALRDIGDTISQAVRDFGEAVGLGGGGARGDRGDQADRVGRTRPQARPSIMSRGDQLVATRDIPRYGITAGQVFDTPDYGMYSARGIMSTDPAQVARVIQARERAERADAMSREGSGLSGGEGADRAAEARKGARAAAEPETPAVPAGEAKGGRPGAEGTGESAAARARRLGLASTIATTPGGLLADSEATRRRRSLIGGGLIQ